MEYSFSLNECGYSNARKEAVDSLDMGFVFKELSPECQEEIEGWNVQWVPQSGGVVWRKINGIKILDDYLNRICLARFVPTFYYDKEQKCFHIYINEPLEYANTAPAPNPKKVL